MFFTPIFILFTLFLLANTQPTTAYITTTDITTTSKTITHTATLRLKPTPILPHLIAAVVTPTALGEYLASVTTQPAFTSAKDAIESAIPDKLYRQYERLGVSPFGSWPLAGRAPDWMRAVPGSDVRYISSIMVREIGIMTRAAAAGSAPTNRPRVEVVGAALAVGAAGLAML